MTTGESDPNLIAQEAAQEKAALPYTEIIETNREARETEIRSNALLTPAGRLELGEGKIESQLESDEQILEKLELARDCLKLVEDRKCAVCIDGRGGCCTASEVNGITDGILDYDTKKPPLRAKVPGGLFFYVTLSALGADLEIVRGSRTFDEAKGKIAAKLEAAGYHDGAHTTVLSYASKERTECGAQDGIGGSSETAVQLEAESAANGSANGLDQVTAALSGQVAESFRDDPDYTKVRENVKTLYENGVFSGYDSVKNRNELAATTPGSLELLQSDAAHPTFLHEEDLVVINTIPGTTVDRDEFLDRSGRGLFVFDTWVLNMDIAPLITSNPDEAATLRVSGDYATAFIAHKLVAKGMPAGIISSKV